VLALSAPGLTLPLPLLLAWLPNMRAISASSFSWVSAGIGAWRGAVCMMAVGWIRGWSYITVVEGADGILCREVGFPTALRLACLLRPSARLSICAPAMSGECIIMLAAPSEERWPKNCGWDPGRALGSVNAVGLHVAALSR